jgi:hypothetical protein
MIVALALFATVALLLVLAAGAAAQSQSQMSAKLENVDPTNIDTFYHAIAVTGASSDSISFNVLNTVVKTKDGSVLTKDYTPPVSVQYYYANDTVKYGDKTLSGYEEFQGYTRTDYNAATINVAGASAVIAGKDITVSPKDGGIEFQIGSFSMYMPDGSARSYKLQPPVKSVMATGQGPMAVTVTPQLRAAMMDAMKGGAKFPVNAAPVSIKDIDAKIK